ncbi:MAG TPA: PKD domain-containing protein [Thermoplasmata archaeon]|nr:PKD domain-containing protein [Thermoplasmata archaeon]
MRIGPPGGSVGSAPTHPAIAPGIPDWTDQTGFTNRGTMGPDDFYASAAYDPDLGEVVLYGGCNYVAYIYGYSCLDDQTWVYNGYNWTVLTTAPSSTPAEMAGMGLVWDPQFDAVLLVGGVTQIFTYCGNSTCYENVPHNWTWKFTGTGWTNITSLVGAPGEGVGYASVAYDDALQEAVLVGGCYLGNCTPGFNDYWTLTKAHGWTDAGPAPSVGVGAAWLTQASLVYDRADTEMVLFGGFLWDGGGISNATFTLTAGGWTNVTSTSGFKLCIFVCFTLYPQGRYGASMTWDGQLGRVVMLGGWNGTGDRNDTWYFTNGIWVPSALFASLPSPAISNAAMPSNSSDIAPVLIGGTCDFPLECYNNSWVFEIPPEPVIYQLLQDPAAPNQLNVSGGLEVGSGSGPDLSWAVGDTVTHRIAGSLTDANFTTNETFGGQLSYPVSGTYNLTETVHDYFGVQNSTYQPVALVVPLAVTPSVSPSPTEVGVGVTFNASAIGGTEPYQYRWGFGDGAPDSTAPTPGHTYLSAGVFLAWVNVTDASGNSTNESFPVAVNPDVSVSPAANVSATDLGLPIEFTADPTNGSGAYVHYTWNFGDTLTSSAPAPSHVYTATGSYLVSVNVTDSLGVSAAAETTVTINPSPGVALLSSNATPETGQNVHFTATPSGGTAGFSYAWSFGDGGVGSGATASHVYTATGTFPVTVTLTDAVGETATASTTETVAAAPLIAAPSGTPSPTEVGVAVSFLADASGGSGLLSYLWGFGDHSATSTDSAPTHTYAVAGDYTAWVKVTDGLGVSINESTPVTVEPALTATASASTPATDLGSTIDFVSHPTDGVGAFGYAWTFGDGGTASVADPLYTYAATGTYTVGLVVTDSLGVTATASTSVTVHPLPTGSIGASTLTPTTSTSVQFTATPVDGTGPFSYAWTFGDGSTGTGAAPTHTYSATGRYTVTVTMTDADAKTVVRELNETVSAPPPGSSSGGATPYETYAILGALVVVGVVAAALLLKRRRGAPPPPPTDPGPSPP